MNPTTPQPEYFFRWGDPKLTHAEALWLLVQGYEHVSIAELVKLLQQRGVETKGDWNIPIPESPKVGNVFIWFGLSREAADLILDLLYDERTQVEPAPPLVYLLDGLIPNIEIAKSARHYKKPRWAPVVVNPKTGYEDRSAETTREILRATAREAELG
jgi:hypothetical protein